MFTMLSRRWQSAAILANVKVYCGNMITTLALRKEALECAFPARPSNFS
jgi:hypothetical protein